MTTKFIIHGGFAGHVNDQNDAFFREILKDTSDNPKVLLVYFAKELDRIPVNKEEDRVQFGRNRGSKSISFQVADEKYFSEQVKDVDIVYLHGGNTVKLLETLKKFPRLRELVEGKVVAGESAGAYALATLFYSKRYSGGQASEGLGFVPVQIICHYVGENEEKLPENPKLETLLLADYEYRVF